MNIQKSSEIEGIPTQQEQREGRGERQSMSPESYSPASSQSIS